MKSPYKPIFVWEPYFTDDQVKRLMEIWGVDKEALLTFYNEIWHPTQHTIKAESTSKDGIPVEDKKLWVLLSFCSFFWMTTRCVIKPGPTPKDKKLEALLIFYSGILEAIQDARTPEPSPAEKHKRNKKALKSVKRLFTDLQQCDLWWELLFGPERDKNLTVSLQSIMEKLELSVSEKTARGTRSSRYFPLAVAVGRTMARGGLNLSGYFDDTTYDPPRKGNAAKVIEICIAAAELPPTNNLKQLASIAAREAKLGCN